MWSISACEKCCREHESGGRGAILLGVAREGLAKKLPKEWADPSQDWIRGAMGKWEGDQDWRHQDGTDKSVAGRLHECPQFLAAFPTKRQTLSLII